MPKYWLFRLFFLSSLSVILNCAIFFPRGPEYQLQQQARLLAMAQQQLARCIQENGVPHYEGLLPRHTKIDSLQLNPISQELNIFLSKHFSFQPFRPESIEKIYQLFRVYLGKPFRLYRLHIFTLGYPVERLVPNFFQTDTTWLDYARMPVPEAAPRIPLVECVNKRSWQPTKGLFNRNLVLAPSHGWYYSQHFQRWEWQRPRLFSRVEDLLPLSFTVPYLVPMLENAGARVFLTRERDFQINEVIVDNDFTVDTSATGIYREINAAHWQTDPARGFAQGVSPYDGNFNPFQHGTHRIGVTDTVHTAGVEWIPNIPEAGIYAVYITFVASPENTSQALYQVFHAGGRTDFRVNQQIAGSTWLYLGQFKFKKGINPTNGRIVLLNQAPVPGQKFSADAVRFGGGMGNIVRGGEISGYPRYAEGARYYLQYLGMPDSAVYNLTNNENDYQDDYQSRSEYANYLKGKPFGPNVNRELPGLQIPIDAYLAFHTDAGIVADSSVGTLMIYRITDQDTLPTFPDGVSRLANRDLGDLVQTEIVKTIRARYDPDWSRRALMEADYSEARRPNMPACLLELLSHQNFHDMKFALDPRFRFDVARAIYIGILKFFSSPLQKDYVVAPLPITHFRACFSDSNAVTLRWRPQIDVAEPAAQSEKYIVYTRLEDGGFDNGRIVNDTTVVFNNLQKNVIYSYQVTAVNAGGESFPSEILAVCRVDDRRSPVLIVNGFDRLCSPAFVDEPRFKGFAHFLDAGVSDCFDFGFTGRQFDFNPQSNYRSNDAPGHGSSYAAFETRIIAGNNFDYPFCHGLAIRACQRSFISCSDEALSEQLVSLKNLEMIDLILGEEKATLPPGKGWYDSANPADIQFNVFPAALQNVIKKFLRQGGRLFVSGAHVGSALMEKASRVDSLFARDWLRINWQTGYASQSGWVFSIDSLFLPPFEKIQFNTQPHPSIYPVESPDAINPAFGATTLMRYLENRFSAVVGYRGEKAVVVAGFPFETIIEAVDRQRFMQAVLNYLYNID